MEETNVEKTPADANEGTTTTTNNNSSNNNNNNNVSRQRTPAASQNILEGEEENFMTMSPKEKAVWIKMIKLRHASLVKKEKEHKKWHDSLTQRRVDVYNRSRKLLNAQRERFRFLFKMSEVVKKLSENKLKDENGERGTEENNNNNNTNTNNNDNTEGSLETVVGNVNTDDDKVNNASVQRSNVENGNNNEEGDNLVPTIMVHEPTQ